MSSSDYSCRYCLRHRPLNVAGLCSQCMNDVFADDDKATVQGISKLLKLSTATLKRLEATGQLIASRNEAGSRRYSRDVIESYMQINSDKVAARLGRDMVKEVSMDAVDKLSAQSAFFCQRCQQNDIYDKNYCYECLTDFISKVEASELLGVSLPRLERLLEEYPEFIQTYPYMTQVRMSRSEVEHLKTMQPDKKIARGAKWSSHFRQCRICKSTDNEHYGGGYCIECYSKSNEAKLLQGYIGGENLAEIGKRLGFSRERARQLFNKAVAIDIERLGDVSEYQKQEMRDQIELAYKQNRSINEFKSQIDARYESIVKQLTSEIILSESGLLKSIGLPASAIYVIEEEYPEFLEIISRNKHRWSWKYDECRMCGTTEIKHKRWGYCENCYTKSDEWKEQQYRWRSTNYEKFRAAQKAYEAEYYKRPEVMKRMNEKSYKRRYDGNREATIKSDRYKCRDCGMDRDEHKTTYGQDLGVLHLDGVLENNDLSNLITLCKSCAAKRVKNLPHEQL